ncbi:MAG: diadenylate cyclase CdaA [Bacillota bacterium]
MLSFLQAMTWLDFLVAVVDILLVSYLIYRLFLLIRGTRAVPLLNGVALLLLATAASRLLQLDTLHWILQYAQLGLVVGLPIVFQPELRRALEQVGRGSLLARPLRPDEVDPSAVIDAVVSAAVTLSRNRTGALIVLERETGLNDIAETGIPLDSLVSTELLVNLFVPSTPLHDGAVIIRGDRIVAAGCFLPLTEARDLDSQIGSRHRAALGISEQSDAVTVVVSEETGAISIAHNGKLIRQLDDVKLRHMLTTMLGPERPPVTFNLFRQRSVSG